MEYWKYFARFELQKVISSNIILHHILKGNKEIVFNPNLLSYSGNGERHDSMLNTTILLNVMELFYTNGINYFLYT
jgi:hypothetical protein